MSTHFSAFEYSKSWSQVTSMAEFELPQAGNTVSKRLRDTSQYVFTPSGRAKGHTPPMALSLIHI